MDYLFTKEKPRENEDMDLFGTICDNDLMGDNWTPNNPDDLLDSFFSMNDDLMGFDETKGFDCLDDISAHIKKEAEEYELTSNIDPVFHNYSSQPNGHVLPNTSISSNSSDSGLSSDNLDVEMSPEYEPLSPAISSPGPSISERGANSPTKATIPINIVNATGGANQTTASTKVFTVTSNIVKPRVIVQKVPQNFTAVQTAPRTINLAQAEGVKIIKLSPQMFTTSNGKKVTIQLKNSSSAAQLEGQQGTFVLNKKNGAEVKKLIRVQNALNPRSILLPVSIQDVRGLGNIKIINATSLKKQNSSPQKVNLVVQQPKFKQGEAISTAVTLPVKKEVIKEELITVDQNSDGDSFVFDEFYDDDVEETESISYQNESTTESDQPYPKLSLTPEEKRLLAKEGISLPSHFPLTKHEERELKRIRRKIRNKISAQDSRKRKKEYVDGLEERVKQCTEENQTLLKRIKMLQNQNHNLMSQMKKLQSLLSKGTNKTAQPATCLMVLLLSLALVAAPNLKLGRNAKESELAEVVKETILQNRRSLLFDVKDQIANLVDDDFLMDEAQIPSDEALESELVVEPQQPHCKKPKLLVDFDVDDENWYHSKEVQGMQRKSQQNFNSLAEEYQKQKDLKNTQTSGFNIADDPEVFPNLKPLEDRKQIDFFDEDIMEMITKRSEGIYELNLDKMGGIHGDEVVYEIAGAKMIPQKVDMKLNASQMGSFQKY